jgi:hypothetical protein
MRALASLLARGIAVTAITITIRIIFSEAGASAEPKGQPT